MTDVFPGCSIVVDGVSGTVEHLVHENIDRKSHAIILFLEAFGDLFSHGGRLDTCGSESLADVASLDLAVAIGVSFLCNSSDECLELFSEVLAEGSAITLGSKVNTEGGGGEESSSEEFHCVVLWFESCKFYLLL